MSLPNAQVPTFGGNSIEYCHFIRLFKNLIEAKTTSSNTQLYYLVQYTSGEVLELKRSCLSMVLKKDIWLQGNFWRCTYRQNYRITAAYLHRIIEVHLIRAEDGKALWRLSVLLICCKNTLKEVGYLHKLHNLDS